VYAGASSSFAAAGGHTDDMLAFAAAHLEQWTAATDKLVSDIHGCSWCGRVALGGAHSQIRGNMKPRTHPGLPPAVVANPMLLRLAEYAHADESRCVHTVQVLLS
jgi:hypothetical protein